MAGKHTRITLSVPIDLKEQMDLSGRDVNWSAVACQAFRDKLKTLIAPASSMEAVLERLRSTVDHSDRRLYATYRQRGDGWGRDEATAAELERVNALRESAVREHGSLENWLDAQKPGPWTNPMILGMTILGGGPINPEAAVRRAADVLGDPIAASKPNAEQRGDTESANEAVRGFIDGVADLWLQVRDMI